MNIKEFVTSITRIDKTVFLRSVLVEYISLDTLKIVLENGIHAAQIEASVLDEVAEKRIRKYAAEACEISFCAGSIGGIWMMPADYTQFFISCTQLLQELYYLYGKSDQLPYGSAQEMEMLLCMMAGGSSTIKSAGSAFGAFSRFLLKKTGKKAAFRFIPVVGGISSAAFTYTSIVSLAHEFIDYLKQMTDTQPLARQIETFIDVEYQEAEAAIRRFCNLEKLKELYQYAEAGYLSDEEFVQLKKEI